MEKFEIDYEYAKGRFGSQIEERRALANNRKRNVCRHYQVRLIFGTTHDRSSLHNDLFTSNVLRSLCCVQESGRRVAEGKQPREAETTNDGLTCMVCWQHIGLKWATVPYHTFLSKIIRRHEQEPQDTVMKEDERSNWKSVPANLHDHFSRYSSSQIHHFITIISDKTSSANEFISTASVSCHALKIIQKKVGTGWSVGDFWEKKIRRFRVYI